MKPTPNPTPNGTKPPAKADAATPKQHDNGPAVIVFGYNEQRIPQAAWFPASEADLGLNGGAIVYHRGRGTVYQGGGHELTAC